MCVLVQMTFTTQCLCYLFLKHLLKITMHIGRQYVLVAQKVLKANHAYVFHISAHRISENIIG